VAAPVEITPVGLVGDAIGDMENYGGPDQAVYLFGAPDSEWWSEELGRDLHPGTFGENLTLSDLESARACIGDRFAIGPVVLEVTAPRIPCVTLAVRMGDPTIVKRFRRSERLSLYCRVIREGEVQVEDPVEHEPCRGEQIPALEVFRTFFEPNTDERVLVRFLSASIAVRAREVYERRLALTLARNPDVRSLN
jgi:MOSC domain-containing protein YiiM